MYGPAIQNLIFDLGGVILNLNTVKTYEAFGLLAGVPAQTIKDTLAQTSFFNDYQQGLLSDSEFRGHIRNMLRVAVSDRQIDEAWNAMLGGLPMERLQLLERLSQKHRVFLLSNNNSIHLQQVNTIVRRVSGSSNLDAFFHRSYYSHLLKMRKPELAIFEHVLTENELIPAHTLFLNDNVDNLRGAEKAGIKTAHVTYPDMIFSIFA